MIDQSQELSEFTAQFQIPHQNINNPESLSFQIKSRNSQSIQSVAQISNAIPEQPQQIQIDISLQSDTEQYLNISFQDIIQLLFNNQCPQLVLVLKQVIFRSWILVTVALFLNLLFIINEVIALYFSLITSTTKDPLIELFSVYFGFNLISDCIITYMVFQLRYEINEAEQINQGDVSHSIIEYLKYTIKINSPFDDIIEDDEQITQAQYVAISISDKITTYKWMVYLLGQNSHMFALNRLSLLAKIILFIWGNITIVQWISINWNQSIDTLEQILLVLTIFSMIIGYIVILIIISLILMITAAIPVIIGIVIWQSCSWIQFIYNEYRINRIEQQRQRFLLNLKTEIYSSIKEQDNNISEDCAICLQTYLPEDECVKLPCNVEGGGGRINHLFHDVCIRIWIESQGQCPICRTIFVERYDI